MKMQDFGGPSVAAAKERAMHVPVCDKDTIALRFVVSRFGRSCVLGGVQIDFSGIESVQCVGVTKGEPIAGGIYLHHRENTIGCHYLRAVRKIEKLANFNFMFFGKYWVS